MIKNLRVQNLAIIENVSIHFETGLTVLTGETGAGKTLLIDALSLVLGAKADADQVRTGEQKAVIEMEFDIAGHKELADKAQEIGIDTGSGKLEILREVSLTGRSSCKVNHQAIPLSELRELGHLMIDLHGQHDHQALLDPRNHLAFYDAWSGSHTTELLNKLAFSFRALIEAKRKLDSIRKGRRDWERRLDTLRYEIKEIEKVNPVPGELELLEQNIQRLRNSEKLVEYSSRVLNSLTDNEFNAESLIGQTISDLSAILKFDHSLVDVTESLRETQYFLQEVSHQLRDYQESLEADPLLLEATAQRVDQLQKLRRKYGDDESAILAHLETSKLELVDLEGYDGDENSLLEKVDQLQEEYDRLAEELSTERRNNTAKFVQEIEDHFADLALERAKLEVSISISEPTAKGIDRVEFLFSANPGEPVKPLSKVASGGEMSRTMLALKAALAGRAGVPTLIFDEVDTGLSGRVAHAVAKKLHDLGKFYQVLVISHLPQTAATADHHFGIEKVIENGRSKTTITGFDRQQKINAIAKMIGGEIVSESALVHAAELLSSNR